MKGLDECQNNTHEVQSQGGCEAFHRLPLVEYTRYFLSPISVTSHRL